MFSRRWLIAAVAACVLASACSQFNTNLSIQTSSSSLAFLSPQTKNAGDGSFMITANGSGFVTGAFILWNGAQLADTTFRSRAPEKVVRGLEATLAEQTTELQKLRSRLEELQAAA